MGQTVNLLSFDFGGSNPSYPTKAFQATAKEGKEKLCKTMFCKKAEVAQLVELQPSKLEVAGSRPVFRSLISFLKYI